MVDVKSVPVKLISKTWLKSISSSAKIGLILVLIRENNIPPSLTQLDRWVVWKYIVRDGKKTKPPFSVITGKHTSVKDCKEHVTFKRALGYASNNKFEGVGLVLDGEDIDGLILVGLDFDKCGDDVEILRYLEDLNTYVETSPSGNGYRAYLWATVDQLPKFSRYGKFEVYWDSRYLTVTGNKLDFATREIGFSPDAFSALLKRFGPPAAPKRVINRKPVSNHLSPSELLEKIKDSADGNNLLRLWEQPLETDTRKSEDDLALSGILARWCNGDYARTEELFRMSPRSNREKSANREEYVRRTIERACANVDVGYTVAGRTSTPAPTNSPSGSATVEIKSSREDVKEGVVTVLENSRKPMRRLELKVRVNRLVKCGDRQFSRSVKDLIEEGVVFKTEPDKRKSPLTIEKPLDITGRPLVTSTEVIERLPILPFMNENIGGGVKRGSIFLFNALSDTGKTYFYLNCFINSINMGLKAKYVFFEGSDDDFVGMIGHIIKKPIDNTVYVNENLFVSMHNAFLEDNTMKQLCIENDVLIIDYMKLEYIKAKAENVSLITSPGGTKLQMIEQFAKAHNCTVITGVQVKNVEEGRKGFVKIDYFGGNSWIQPAPHSWTIYDFETIGNIRHLDIHIDKSKSVYRDKVVNKVYPRQKIRVSVNLDENKYEVCEFNTKIDIKGK